MIHTLAHLFNPNVGALVNGKYVIAIPEMCNMDRIKDAWAVLTGKAIALRYPKDGELEETLAKGGVSLYTHCPRILQKGAGYEIAAEESRPFGSRGTSKA